MSLDNKPSSETADIRTKLSALWIVVALNYVYGDVFTLLGKGAIINFTQQSLFGAAVLVETPIAMVFFSRIVKNYQVNRWSNIVVGAINLLATIASLIVGLLAGTQYAYNVFFAVIEVATIFAVIWYAWEWHKPVQEQKIAQVSSTH